MTVRRRRAGDREPTEDFAAAHRRHWRDAEALFGISRLGNADHLYGFSAECGLKAIIAAWGQMGPRYYKHLPGLWNDFVELAIGREGEHYIRLLPSGEPFADWSVQGRYRKTGYDSHHSVREHRRATGQIGAMVQALKEPQ